MSATPEQQKRVALAIKPDAAHVVWVNLDQTGQPPRVIDDMIKPRLELISLDDSPIAIYRADTDESYTRDSLAALAELVRVVNGLPNVSADVDEQMRQLREQLRATIGNAEEMISEREHRIEKIIEQARAWKAAAAEGVDTAERRNAEHASTIAELRASRREIAELQDQLQVARNAVERSVNRSNHSNEHVGKARERERAADANAARHAQESADLRQQLGQATAEVHDLRERIVEVQANALDTINRVAAALPGPVVDAEVVTPDVEVNTWFGEDNVPVVQIDTRRGDGSRLRISLNDGVVWDGNPETDERPGSHAEPEEFSNEAARAADGATISRQLDTIRDQEKKIEHLEDQLKLAVHHAKEHEIRVDRAESARERAEDERNAAIRQATARQASIEALQAERDEIHNDRANEIAKVEQARAESRTLRGERNQFEADLAKALSDVERYRSDYHGCQAVNGALTTERDDLDRKLTESETMRKRLDERLAAERRVYETTSAALRAMLRERDDVIGLAKDALYPISSSYPERAASGIAFRLAADKLPRLEAEENARDGGLIDVIRQYDGLAQIGANLARAVDSHIAQPISSDAANLAGLSAHYQREHAKLKR